MIGDTIRHRKDHGRMVVYDAEHAFDGFRDEPEYAMATWQAAEKAGADVICLCDTNGGRLPSEIADIVTQAHGQLNARIGIHTHNDCGFGVAGIAALSGGSLPHPGNGQRIRGAHRQLQSHQCHSDRAFQDGLEKACACLLLETAELSEFVDEIANVRHDTRQPWVGQTAFAHKGGIHVHAIERVARSYEHIQPESVGNHRRVLVSDMSGRTNILLKAAELAN